MFTDEFAPWSTQELTAIAYRVTPSSELDHWVATANARRWIVRDGWATATDGTRDEQGVRVVVRDLAEEDLRDFTVEQLTHYGITLQRVNWMKS